MLNKYDKIKNVIQKLSCVEKNNYEIRSIESYNYYDIYYYNNTNKCYDKNVKDYINLQIKNINNKDLILFSLLYPHISAKGLYSLIKMIWRAQKNVVNTDKSK